MTGTTTAAAVQFPIAPGQVEKNLDQALAALHRLGLRKVRLAVLPEMWSTGFDYRSLPDEAEKTPAVLEQIADSTKRLNMVVVGSLPEKVDGALFNTTFVVDDGRVAGTYRKMHLFSPMGEHLHFQAGSQILVVPTSAGRLGMAICYDLRFPELFRLLTLSGAEIICLPAEWPAPRQEQWRTLIKARAIENQLFLIAANCCGRQGRFDFFGMSLIVSPQGEILAEAGTEAEEITADLDFAAMRDYREKIPALKDRRADVYGNLP
ncbi:MAG: carbon-nitrogen family hydrolase [Syntrophotaleaceae bacterium]